MLTLQDGKYVWVCIHTNTHAYVYTYINFCVFENNFVRKLYSVAHLLNLLNSFSSVVLSVVWKSAGTLHMNVFCMECGVHQEPTDYVLSVSKGLYWLQSVLDNSINSSKEQPYFKFPEWKLQGQNQHEGFQWKLSIDALLLLQFNS